MDHSEGRAKAEKEELTYSEFRGKVADGFNPGTRREPSELQPSRSEGFFYGLTID